MKDPRTASYFRPTETIRALGLDERATAILSRRLDRALTGPTRGTGALRDALRAAAAEMLLAGTPMSDILLRLSRLVEEHARERGWTATSVVSGQPRFASVIAKLPEWLLPPGAPASHESEPRSASAAT